MQNITKEIHLNIPLDVDEFNNSDFKHLEEVTWRVIS